MTSYAGGCVECGGALGTADINGRHSWHGQQTVRRVWLDEADVRRIVREEIRRGITLAYIDPSLPEPTLGDLFAALPLDPSEEPR